MSHIPNRIGQAGDSTEARLAFAEVELREKLLDAGADPDRAAHTARTLREHVVAQHDAGPGFTLYDFYPIPNKRAFGVTIAFTDDGPLLEVYPDGHVLENHGHGPVR